LVKRARPALSSHRALACIARSGYFSCTWREQPRCTQCANEVLHLSKRYNLFRIVVGRIRVRACWDLVGCGVWRLRNSPRAKPTSCRDAWPAKCARSDGLGDWGCHPGETPVSRVKWIEWSMRTRKRALGTKRDARASLVGCKASQLTSPDRQPRP